MTLVARVLLGAFAGLVLATAIAGVGSLSLSHDRLVQVVKEAITNNEFASSEENFTECSLLQMQMTRYRSTRRDIVRSVWMRPVQLPLDHPCETLGRLASGETALLPPAADYLNYPFGPRYLLAAELSVLSFHATRIATAIISYGSVIALALALFRRNHRAGLVLLPTIAALVLAFGLHRYADNVAHAPAYWVGFGFLAAMASLPPSLTAQLANRLAGFAALGALIGFFDLLTGSIPVLLSLVIVVNHFVWGDRGSWRSAVGQALAVAASFAFGCVALIVLRLNYLSLEDGNVWQVFFNNTGARMNGNTLSDVAVMLWNYRYELAPGGMVPGAIFLGLCGAAWVVAAAMLAWRRAAALDVFVLAGAALGVLAWCALFRSHTAYHAFFTVRLLTLPAAYGLSALTVVLLSRAPRAARADSVAENRRAALLRPMS
jgi:hypothetical protein